MAKRILMLVKVDCGSNRMVVDYLVVENNDRWSPRRRSWRSSDLTAVAGA